MLLAGVVGISAQAKPPKHPPVPTPPVRFAILSDLHLYNTKLGTEGTPFETYVLTDQKLLALSEPILDAVIADILARDVQFVVITGDLTKDGEVLDHVLVTQHLQTLRRAGIGVYVLPGNHDINNGDALKYIGETTRPVPTASPHVFRALYERFGYGQALDHAPDSLSYVAEPVPGLWLLAIDSAKWAESAHAEHPIVSGRITPATMNWVLAKIQQGQARGKHVIAFMHHGVNPHFLAEIQVFPDYLVDNWPVIGAQLAGAGLRVVFTGHYHSQDASACTVDAQGQVVPTPLCDIETGSLISYPCAYRYAELTSDGVLHVTSQRVTQVNADLGGLTFQQYAENFSKTLLPLRVTADLEQMFGLTPGQAAVVAPWVADALMANYAGDEAPDATTQALIAWLMASPEPMPTLGAMLYTLWNDLPPADNTLDVAVD